MFGRDYAFHWTDAPRFAKGQGPPGGVTPWAAIGDAYYYAVGLIVLLGVPLLFAKGDRRHLIVAWFIASWCLIHLMYTPRPRHHFAVLPMVSLFAGIVLVEIWDRVRSRRGPPPRKVQVS
ncbi:MAG: hypothetical protein IIB22_00995 [Chloroflexi bacterium]|nr:hypothetical protein [Chloroflexota bacterium]MCH8161074.1 hypothetical protein [Chloroflexota bacterium]